MTSIKVNESNDDRRARITLGVFLFAIGIAMTGIWGIVLIIIGLVLLFSGLVGWCPIYALFKNKHVN